jgi:hypothetical protein
MAGNGKDGQGKKKALYPGAAEEALDVIKGISKFYVAEVNDGKNKKKILKGVPAETLSDDELAEAIAAYQNLDRLLTQYEEDGKLPKHLEERYKNARIVGRKYEAFWNKNDNDTEEKIIEPELIEEGPKAEEKRPDYEDTACAGCEIAYMEQEGEQESPYEPENLELYQFALERNDRGPVGSAAAEKPAEQPAPEEHPQSRLERIAEMKKAQEECFKNINESYENCITHLQAMRGSIAEMKDEEYIDSYEIQELESRKGEDEKAAIKYKAEEVISAFDGAIRQYDILIGMSKE